MNKKVIQILILCGSYFFCNGAWAWYANNFCVQKMQTVKIHICKLGQVFANNVEVALENATNSQKAQSLYFSMAKKALDEYINRITTGLPLSWKSDDKSECKKLLPSLYTLEECIQCYKQMSEPNGKGVSVGCPS